MRCDFAIEVPGTAAMCRVKWPSLSSGRKLGAEERQRRQPTSVKARAPAIVVRGRATIPRSRRS